MTLSSLAKASSTIASLCATHSSTAPHASSCAITSSTTARAWGLDLITSHSASMRSLGMRRMALTTGMVTLPAIMSSPSVFSVLACEATSALPLYRPRRLSTSSMI